MTGIVVDVGCKSHEAEVSIPKLIDRFDPQLLLGFDPHPQLGEGVSCMVNTTVVTRRAAAWTCNGSLAFRFDGTRSAPNRHAMNTVPCFDLSALLRLALPPVGIVLKLDIEGGEYRILDHLLRTGADRLLALVLVEWHELDREHRRGQRARLERELRCPVEPW